MLQNTPKIIPCQIRLSMFGCVLIFISIISFTTLFGIYETTIWDKERYSCTQSGNSWGIKPYKKQAPSSTHTFSTLKL